MPKNTKWKIAIFTGTSKCLVYVAEAKYCASEIHGEPKYYECPKNEYCCTFGCCVSPGFHFYHLWYYWLLVIIMFLVCSGGGWWYRYYLHGRYRTTASSTISSRTPSNSRRQIPVRGPMPCHQTRQARIAYNPGRNTVLLQRMWKGHQRGGYASSGSYGSGATSSAHFQNTSVMLNETACPYYQLYGPPPSYETVIAETRAGKVHSPSLGMTASNGDTAPHVEQCLAYLYSCSSTARSAGPPDESTSANIPPDYREPRGLGRSLRHELCSPLPMAHANGMSLCSARYASTNYNNVGGESQQQPLESNSTRCVDVGSSTTAGGFGRQVDDESPSKFRAEDLEMLLSARETAITDEEPACAENKPQSLHVLPANNSPSVQQQQPNNAGNRGHASRTVGTSPLDSSPSNNVILAPATNTNNITNTVYFTRNSEARRPRNSTNNVFPESTLCTIDRSRSFDL